MKKKIKSLNWNYNKNFKPYRKGHCKVQFTRAQFIREYLQVLAIKQKHYTNTQLIFSFFNYSFFFYFDVVTIHFQFWFAVLHITDTKMLKKNEKLRRDVIIACVYLFLLLWKTWWIYRSNIIKNYTAKMGPTKLFITKKVWP